jgi:hypothetical protein
MTEENYLHDADDAADPDDLAFAADALGHLTFLRPDASDEAESTPMPDWAWTRLTKVLAAESEARAHAASSPAHGRSSRGVRWGGGLVAASVAVVAVGLGITTLRGSGADVAVVAADAPSASVAAEAKAFSAQEAPVAGDALAAADLQAPRELSFAGFVPPVRKLIDSEMNYTSAGLGAQVRSVLAKNGMGSADETESMMAAPAPTAIAAPGVPASGFTADADILRDCITKLADAAATALMVDRSTFDGSDAGVVVAPEEGSAASSPSPTELQVWVIDADCNITTTIRISLAP